MGGRAMSPWMTWTRWSPSVFRAAASTASSEESIARTSAPYRAAKKAWRPNPQPASITSLPRKSSGFSGEEKSRKFSSHSGTAESKPVQR